jgi:hypothetical protein
MGVAALLLAWAAGWLLVRGSDACTGLRPRWAVHALEASLGFAIGLGARSALFFALLWAGMGPRAASVLALAATAAAGAFLLWRRRAAEQTEQAANAPPAFRWTWACLLAFVVALVIFLAGYGVASAANPEGEWDAWAIWNLRAKFLAGPGSWRHAVSPELGRTHPEYPLLWSGAIGGAWASGGEEGSPAVPIVAGALAASAAAAGLAGAVAVLQSPALGSLAGLILLAGGAWWRQAASQYADVPLSLYIVAALAAAAIARKRDWHVGALLLSGVLASMAAWTKNEGMLFFVVCAATVAAVARARCLPWIAGALPVALLTAAFKLLLAPALRSFDASVAADAKRIGAVAAGFWRHTLELGDFPAHPLLLAAILCAALGVRRPLRVHWTLVPVLSLLAGDFAVVCASTNDLAWQIDTAVERLLVQALPALLFALCLTVNAPASPTEEVQADRRAAAPAPRGRRK